MSRTIASAHGVRAGLLAAVALALLATGLAAQQAQPDAGKTVRMGLPTHSLQYLGNAALLTELKITPEQKSKLGEMRTKFWTDFFALDVKDHVAKLAEMSAAADKALAQFFTPEQMKRLQQITVQQAEKRWGAGRAVRLPAVAEALKLSDTQTARLAKGEEITKVLSEAQQKQWTEMRGPAFETELRVSFPGGVLGKGGFPDFGKGTFPGGKKGIGTSPSLTSLAAADVQKELRLSDEQIKAVADLQEKWSKSAAEIVKGTKDDVAKARAALTAETTKAIAGLLKAEQAKRHDQILLQDNLRFASGSGLYKTEAVAKGIGLTDEQRKEMDRIDAERYQGIAAVILADRSLEEITKDLADYKKASAGLIDKVITAEQHTRFKELVGKPFEGTTKGKGGKKGFGEKGGEKKGGVPAGLNAPGSAYNFSVFVLTFLRNPELQAELKLSDDQMAQLTKLRTKWVADMREVKSGFKDDEAVKKVRELAQTFHKDVAGIAPPEQAKRIMQVGLQVASRDGGGTGLFGNRLLWNFIEVSDGLKLTKEQQDRLTQGEGVEKVLSKEQQGRWKEMLGEPIKSASLALGKGPGFGTPALPDRLYHLTLAVVQQELKLSEEQLKQVQSQVAEWRQSASTKATRPQLVAAMDEAIDKMLKPEQQQRLRQIAWQQIEERGMTLLLTTAEFTKALGLSDKQQETTAAVRKEHTAVLNMLDRELFRPGPDGNKAFQQASQTLSKRTEGRLMALLSKEQQTRMTEILGRTFEGTIPTQSPFGGGGPGGAVRPGMAAFDPPR